MIKTPQTYASYFRTGKDVDPEVVVRWILRDMKDLVDVASNEGMGYPWVQNRLDQVLSGSIAPVDVEIRNPSKR